MRARHDVGSSPLSLLLGVAGWDQGGQKHSPGRLISRAPSPQLGDCTNGHLERRSRRPLSDPS